MAGALLDNLFLAVVYTVLGGFLGILLMAVAVMIVPKLMDKLTPKIDEEKEIAKGNMAVATYFGQVVHAVILGIAIIIAAAIVSGIF